MPVLKETKYIIQIRENVCFENDKMPAYSVTLCPLSFGAIFFLKKPAPKQLQMSSQIQPKLPLMQNEEIRLLQLGL